MAQMVEHLPSKCVWEFEFKLLGAAKKKKKEKKTQTESILLVFLPKYISVFLLVISFLLLFYFLKISYVHIMFGSFLPPFPHPLPFPPLVSYFLIYPVG
jgi:hypothetical protein